VIGRPFCDVVPVHVPSQTGAVNVAVTVSAAMTVVTQSPVPEQPPPDQPANVDPALAATVSVTTVPWSKTSSQSPPQSALQKSTLSHWGMQPDSGHA
jgi:hypothetical protein